MLGTAAALILPNGSIDVRWDPKMQMIQFIVSVKNGTYIAFGWGDSMKQTDMVVWRANDK